MPDGFKPAKPFSNGSEADRFEVIFCTRCAKCKLDEMTLEPRDRCCPTYRATARAYTDIDFWPKDGSIKEDIDGRRVCIDFFSENPDTMASYEKAVPQTYAGYRLKNLADGYVALDKDGNAVLRSGTKDRLETMLLVVHADRMQSVFTSPDGKDASAEEKL